MCAHGPFVSLCPFWVAVLWVAAPGCNEPSPVRTEASETPPADPLEGLAPWSDAWVLAHAPRYLEDDAARRSGLEAALENPENLYSRARLGAYGHVERGWDALPEWSPPTAPMTAARAAAFERGERPTLDGLAPIGARRAPKRWEDWRALGERVFFELPLRSEPFWEVALRDPARGEALGVERAPDGSVPGLVVMRDVDGRAAVGITCALCHTARQDVGGVPTLVAGRARRRLDYGRVRLAYYEARGAPIDPVSLRRWRSWGPGRADVLEDVADVPIAIPDLWGLRHERRLAQAGTLRHDSPLALFIRQETQYIQANHHHTRPPRVLMVALSVYLYSLDPPPARASAATPARLARGAELFGTERCARCHENEALAGDRVVEIGQIATDPELATGGARGTGGYRPSPLLRVADAAPYLHHGAVPTLEALFGTDRLEPTYTGGPDGPGPVPGHEFGVSLDDADCAALLAHLETL
ncbi:MAG: hypothetical protein KF729_09035 [Sandaracinaceae bacterium]|nr:hypothetical protein [Sandaracinaceae bacterium]